MNDPVVLDVLLHDKRIGTMSTAGGDRVIFAFTDDYVRDDARETVSLSFKGQSGKLVDKPIVTQTRLPAFFANLLPEGHMRDYLASRAGVKGEREFFLIEALGEDLPGAVQVLPSRDGAFAQSVDTNLEILRKDHQAGDGEPLRFSLAGMQIKLSAVNETKGGLTIPARGVGGSWIVKLPSASLKGVVENEFAMLELARKAAIDVPETKLVKASEIGNLPSGIESAGPLVFATKRFDRESGARIHIEDFAQVFGVYPGDKYKRASYRNIAEVIAIEAGLDDVEEFIRRLTFNVLIGNGDMHLKNWSLIYRDGRQAELAPAYDFVSTVHYLPDDKLALTLAGTRSFSEVSSDLWRRFAEKARIPVHLTLNTVNETVAQFRDAWEKRDVEISEDLRHSIDRHLSRVPIWTELVRR